MKRISMLLALGTALCVGSVAVQAASFNTTLNGANENPVNSSPGVGSSTVSLDTTTHQLQVSAVFSGLSAPTTASHIHCCVAPPGTAGVATTTPSFTGFPLGVTSGSFNAVFDTTQASTWNPAFITANGGTTAGAEAALAAGMAQGRAYLNIHTTAIPAGEIRGFLAPVGTPSVVAAGVPTLSQWSLIGLAAFLSVFGFIRMRRRG
jgi:hypothetical protein